MKQRYTFLSLFLFSVLPLLAQSVRKEHLLQEDMDTKCNAVYRSYDDGFFAVGISGKSKGSTFDKAVVWKYNSSRELVWKKSIAIPLNQGEGIFQADALPLPDGSLVIAVNLFECDVFTFDFLVRISANGSVLWTKETSGVFQKLIPGNGNTFYLYNGNVAVKYNFEGTILLQNLTIPKIREVLAGGHILNCNGVKVWLEDGVGNALGQPWYSPEVISSLDTAANEGVVVFTQDTVYKLSPSLQFIEKQAFTGVGALDIHTFQGGFIHTRNIGIFKQLMRLDTNGQFMQVLGLGAINGNASFVVKDSIFFLGASLFYEDAGYSGWIASDQLVKSENWETGINGNISEMIFVGNQSANVINGSPGTFYAANYGTVSIGVENLGTDTIHSFQANFRIESCDLFCIIDGGIVVRYEFASIPPGGKHFFLLGDIIINCTRQDVGRFCTWISDINHHRDDDIDNNVFCADLSYLFVGTQTIEAEKVMISPNPADDQVFIENGNNASITAYTIIDLSGRMIQSGDLLHKNIPVAAIHNGWYVLQLTTDQGYSTFQKVIIQH